MAKKTSKTVRRTGRIKRYREYGTIRFPMFDKEVKFRDDGLPALGAYRYGFTWSDWRSLTPSQRSEVMDAYGRIWRQEYGRPGWRHPDYYELKYDIKRGNRK